MIDFDWDDQGDMGVYVCHAGDLALVEGAVCQRGNLTGEYLLASQVRLRRGETVRVGDAPLPGMRRGQVLRDEEASAYVAHLARLELGPQVAVNDQQERLRAADRASGRGHLWSA